MAVSGEAGTSGARAIRRRTTQAEGTGTGQGGDSWPLKKERERQMSDISIGADNIMVELVINTLAHIHVATFP